MKEIRVRRSESGDKRVIKQYTDRAKCELSDLIGDVEAYCMNKHNISLEQLLNMAQATKRAFESGRRS